MLTLAIVGCGRVTRIAHLDALKKLESRYRVIAVCDVAPEAAKAAADLTGAKVYLKYDELLKNEKPDLIVLNVANGLHAPLALQAIAAGIKAVAVEKPLAMNPDEADTLIAAAKAANAKLFTILQNRYNPPVRLVKKALDEGRFGRLLNAQITLWWHREKSYYEGALGWHADEKMAGGVFTNQSVHYLDLLLWLAGQKPVNVFARMGRRFGLAVEDYGAAVIGFENGLIASAALSNHAPGFDREGSLTLIGEKGMIKIGGKALNRLELWAFDEPRPGDENAYEAATEPPTVYGYGHCDFYKAVADCLEKNECDQTISGEEGRRSVRLLDALYESARAGQSIPLD